MPPPVLYTTNFSGWLSDAAWVRAGDALIVDGWGGSNAVDFVASHLAFWGSNPATEQSPFLRSTTATRVLTGFPPDTFVTVVLSSSWRLGDTDGFVGLRVNAAPFAPGSGPSGTLVAPTVAMTAYGTTTALGELTLQFAIENVHPSLNINISFDDLTVYEGYFDPDLLSDMDLADIIQDTAKLYYNTSTPISITRDGASFVPNWEFEEMDYPGKTVATLGGHAVTGMKPVIRATVMLTGEAQLLVYAPGGTWSDGPYGRRYTPPAMGVALAAGVYLSAVRCIWKRLRGDFLQVHFPKALVTAHTIEGRDKDEGQIAVDIEAVQDLTTGTPGTVRPFYYDILPVGTEVEE